MSQHIDLVKWLLKYEDNFSNMVTYIVIVRFYFCVRLDLSILSDIPFLNIFFPLLLSFDSFKCVSFSQNFILFYFIRLSF